jgi:hypothetical protein
MADTHAPLSDQWWVAFRSRAPKFDETKAAEFCLSGKNVQHASIGGQNVLVIGGKPACGPSAWIGTDIVADFLDSSSEDGPKYDKRVEVGHIAEYLLETQYQYGGARVFEASAMDYNETAVESRSAANRKGLCVHVSDTELYNRAAWLFDGDGLRLAADVIGSCLAKAAIGRTKYFADTKRAVLNFDVAIPVAADQSFETYIEYLSGRKLRALQILSAVGRAWKASLEDAEEKPRRMIVVLNSLLGWLPTLAQGQGTSNQKCTSTQQQAT